MRQRMQPERARRNCPNSELPSSNLDQFFVSPLGGAKKRLGASDLTRGLHGHSCLRVRVGTLELAKWDKSPTKLHFCGFAGDLSRQNRLLTPARLEDGACLNLNNCLPAGGVQAPCKTVVGSRNRSQI